MKISNTKFLIRTVLTLLGFALAEVGSFAIPTLQNQTFVIRDEAYRAILAGLMVIYLGSGIFSWFSETRRVKYAKRAPFRLFIGLVLLVWDMLGTKFGKLHMPFFPGPSQITWVFVEEWEFLLSNLLYSLRLYAFGFFSGVFLGVGTGILIGWFSKANYWIMPVLKMTGVIPAVAWMPFALNIFPSSFLAGCFLVSMCAWFPIGFQTARGMQATQKVYFEVARTIGGGRFYQLFHVAIPNALPTIFTGVSTANGLAFTTLVMTEMMGARGGLGYYINWAKAWSSYYKVYAAIIIMAILFSIILKIIGAIQNRALIWQRGLTSNVEERG
ncbi:MAG: ABC transporter permease subunit [Oscillospiraceae bacterium]|jgi:NitT/TauT family transport system permease protein|nr:ABC transporter permease subunit [Oscillospiraceae bacterium]